MTLFTYWPTWIWLGTTALIGWLVWRTPDMRGLDPGWREAASLVLAFTLAALPTLVLWLIVSLIVGPAV